MPATVLAAASLMVCGAPLAADCTSADTDGKPRLLQKNDLEVTVEPAALQRQYSKLLGMTLEKVDYSARGPVTSIVGDTGITLPADAQFRPAGAPASDLLPLFKDLLLATGTETLTVRENEVWYGEGRSLFLSQSIRGVPVVNGGVSLGYNARTRRVTGVDAHFVPDIGLPRKPKLTSRQAEDLLRQMGIAHVRKGTHLAYFAEFADPSPPQLVWAVEVGSAYGSLGYFVNAVTGSIAPCRPLSPHARCPHAESPNASIYRRDSTETCRT